MTTTETRSYTAVGKRPIRHDGYDKVTGKANYGADVSLPGMLHAKVLRSPHAHANVRSIDTSAAEAAPGVRAVLTSADFPEYANEPVTGAAGGPPQNMHHVSTKILARDKVLFRGHPVAAVAADSPHEAEEALDLIEVDYEVLPVVTTVEEAMADGAPLLHPEFANNVASHSRLEIGDLDEGFEQADIVIEREFRTKTVHQGYIEPHSATAWWTPQDRITVWGSSQGHFQIRDLTAAVVGVPFSAVKVVPMEIGGGFGGKTTIYLEPIAVALSKKSGQPVKVTMNRIEVMEATGPTSGSYMKVKMGVTNDGRMTAAHADLRFEAGAYPGSPVGAAANCIFSPYDIANIVIDAYDVVDNKPKTTAYRAPGAPIGSFAAETIIDEFCERLDIDPIDFRILNGAKEGTRRATGVINPPIGAIETAQAAKDHPHYAEQVDGKWRGRGVASGFWINGTGPACATANLNYDGTVNLTIGSMDIGGTRPAAAQQFAEVLGIPVEDVNPQVGDTDAIGYTSMTGGSGAAFKTGWASYEAAQDVKRQMIDRAALLWDTPADQIELEGGVFRAQVRPRVEHQLRRPRGPRRRDGRPHRGQREHGSGRRGQRVRHARRRRRGRSGDRQGGDTQVHRRAGLRHFDPPQLRRGPDTGRRRAGHRLGAQRRVLHERRRPDDELEPARLPYADLARPADDRHGGRRSAEPEPPLRRARRRRGADRAAAGRALQRDLRRDRRPHEGTPHEPGRRQQGHSGRQRRLNP